MTPQKTLLDTDIVSAYMRGDPVVVDTAERYLLTHGRLSFSLLTRYEILKGLKAKQASARLRAFDRLCKASSILELTEEIVALASDLYSDLHQRGELIGDLDTLIAATALVHKMSIATNNERHFTRIQGLQIENWLKG
jgi:tRNA(fMet)-specific endonuclease VapC